MAKFQHDNDCMGYHVLKNEDLDMMHEATLQIMEEHGVRIHGSDGHDILAAAGCEVDRKTNMVKFPRNLVNDAIESCPEEFTLCGREPSKDTVVGHKKVNFKNFGTGVNLIDPYTGEVRPTTLKDLGDVCRFIDALPEINTLSVPVTANDVDQRNRTLREAEVIFANCSKNLCHDVFGVKTVERFLKMAAIVQGGYDKLRERPIIQMNACPNSPLVINEDDTNIIILSAKAGVPTQTLSMGLCGATTPATLAGTLVTTNAEILAGLTLTQIVNKGNPTVYGTSTTIMDMRHTTSPVGAPEHALCAAATGQIAHYYGVPCNVGGT